jgi:hypothetical protein
MYSRKRAAAARGKSEVQRLDKAGYLIGFNAINDALGKSLKIELA